MRCSARAALVALVSAAAVGVIGCASEDSGGADASVEANASSDATADVPTFGDGRDGDAEIVGDASGDDGASVSDAGAGDDGSGVLHSTVPGCASGVVCGGHCMAASDIHHCGSCTNDCADLPNVAPAGLACVNGACSYSCAHGFVGCGDAGAPAGCRADLSQPESCGSCGQSCFWDSGTPNCAPTSDAGTFACTGACPPEAPTLCSEECVDLMTNVNHCGDCNGGCFTRVANAHLTCVAAACGVGCNPGYSLCNGACVDETGDVANCGGCGVTCGTNQVCRAGACVCLLTCGGGCVDGDTDPANCGACGHDCLGGACSAGACQPITLASGQIAPFCMALSPTGVYWTNNGTVVPGGGNGSVMGVALDGTHLTTLATGDQPYGIAVDSQYAYWTDANDSILWRSPLDGGGVDGGTKVPLYTGTYPQNELRGVALAAGLVYWADDGAGIFAVPTTGGNRAPVTMLGMNTRHVGVACQIGVDAKNLYYPAYFPVGIDSVPLAGGTPTTLSSISSNLGDGWGVAVGTQSVFFDEYGKSVLYSVPLGGGAATLLVTSPGYPEGLSVYGDRLYWADASGTIRSVPVQGGPQLVHANGQAGPAEVTVDAKAIYWINSSGSVMKVAR